MNTQIALEDVMYNLALNTGDPCLILCDRGLMDSLGYSGPEVWQQILKMKGWSNIELRDQRYDAVIHLVTAADGAAEFYDHDNVARYETVDEAIEIDKALRKAYIGHNKIFMVGNYQTFREKMNETVETVKTIMGFPTNITRFRKYLVDNGGIDFCGSDLECPTKPQYENFHAKLFAMANIEPYNNEVDKESEFIFDTHTFR